MEWEPGAKKEARAGRAGKWCESSQANARAARAATRDGTTRVHVQRHLTARLCLTQGHRVSLLRRESRGGEEKKDSIDSRKNWTPCICQLTGGITAVVGALMAGLAQGNGR